MGTRGPLPTVHGTHSITLALPHPVLVPSPIHFRIRNSDGQPIEAVPNYAGQFTRDPAEVRSLWLACGRSPY